MLNLFNIKVKYGLTDNAFNDILQCIKSPLSLYKLKHKLKSLVGIEPLTIDTCEDSCIAFTEKYATLMQCPICKKNRYISKKPVNSTYFFSIKERLIIQYKDEKRAEELRYRHFFLQQKNSKKERSEIKDIYDGK